MAQAKPGNTVKVHYTGKFDDGEVFDSSVDRDPLEFVIGSGKMIPGFEKAVIGMNVGETRTTTVFADNAYGQYQQDRVFSVEESNFNSGGEIQLKVGQYWQLEKDNGQVINVRIVEISNQKITLDANHPLAGKDLTFDIKLVEVR